jgi:hypothetical protein
MTSPKAARLTACVVTLCCVLMGPVSAATASKASIKHAIESYGSKVDVAEGHVLTAVGEYKETKDPAGVEAAIGKSVAVIGAMKAKVAKQSASAPRVKKAKRKIVSGLQAVIVGYDELSSAYAEVATAPEAATGEIAKAEASVKKGRKQLSEGVKLLD